MKNIKNELELIIKYLDECLEEYPLTKSYDGLDENLVYEIIEKDVPKLREQIYPLLSCVRVKSKAPALTSYGVF